MKQCLKYQFTKQFFTNYYNRSQFGETFNNSTAKTKQDPIIVNLETEYKFPAIEYKPGSEDELEDEELEPKKGFKNYFKSPFIK